MKSLILSIRSVFCTIHQVRRKALVKHIELLKMAGRLPLQFTKKVVTTIIQQYNFGGELSKFFGHFSGIIHRICIHRYLAA